jgi:hypothetical protein
MTGRRTALVVLLILGMAAAVSGRPETTPEQQSRPSAVEQVKVLVEAPIRGLGRSRDSIQAALGPPSSVRKEEVTNPHDPRQTDQVHTLTYPGLVIRIYDVVVFKKEILLSVRMTQNHSRLLPDLIGQNEKAIIASLGSPKTSGNEVWEYHDEEGNDQVRIEFKDAAVVAVEWNYYLD